MPHPLRFFAADDAAARPTGTPSFRGTHRGAKADPIGAAQRGVDESGVGRKNPEVVAAAIVDRIDQPRALLVGQRAYPPELAGKWEFPGGKRRRGETELAALTRELREELGVSAHRVGRRLAAGEPDGYWRVTGGRTMAVYLVELADDRAALAHHPDHLAVRWVDLAHIMELDWIAANRQIAAALKQIAEITATQGNHIRF